MHANRAMVRIRLKKYQQAEDDCSKSLELDPSYTKALSFSWHGQTQAG